MTRCYDIEPTAQQAATEAITRAGDNADPEWFAEALRIVCQLAVVYPEFTTDSVWERLGTTREPRALGAVMRQAAASGVIAKTDRVRPSTRVKCHGRPVAVWVRGPVSALASAGPDTLFG